jgi:sulfur-carrier protein adenylyltransferase/sulfurtransferase
MNQLIPQITCTELKQRLDAGDAIVLIDVREQYEWDTGNLEQYGARWIPLDEVLDRTDEIDRNADVVLYCRSGSRSAAAVRQLRMLGFERVLNLRGGIQAWADEVDPDMMY